MRVVTSGYDPEVPLDSLVEFPDNPNESDTGRLDRSLAALGFYGAVLVQVSTRRILAGHGRAATVRRAGGTTVPVVWVDVDDPTARRIVIGDNATARQATWDPHNMVAILEVAQRHPAGLDALGLTQAEADTYLGAQSEWNPPAPEGSLEDFRREDGNQHALRVPPAHREVVAAALGLVRTVEAEGEWSDSQALAAVARDYLVRHR